jgi:ribonuclease PH
MMRFDGRKNDDLRDFSFELDYTMHSAGSVLARFGNTKVLCNATIEPRVPRWMAGKGEGWVTAEYGMLPASTNTRNIRESTKGKQSGRTLEIQRLIGRSLRGAVDLKLLGEKSILIDCDVLQADGGTRTTAINGAYIALKLAINTLINDKEINEDPIKKFLGAISVGVFKNETILDLNYFEDSKAETDMNIIMNNDGEFIEIQGTAESGTFTAEQLNSMIKLADKGIREIIERQQKIFGEN